MFSQIQGVHSLFDIAYQVYSKNSKYHFFGIATGQNILMISEDTFLKSHGYKKNLSFFQDFCFSYAFEPFMPTASAPQRVIALDFPGFEF